MTLKLPSRLEQAEELRRKIVEEIKANPGLSISELNRRFKRGISHHLVSLEKDGLIVTRYLDVRKMHFLPGAVPRYLMERGHHLPSSRNKTVDSPEVISIKEIVGLSSYQARALLALGVRPQSAQELSSQSGVPRVKIYEILHNLVDLGFASEILPATKVNKKKGIPTKLYVRSRLGLERRIATLETQVSQLKALVDRFRAEEGDAKP